MACNKCVRLTPCTLLLQPIHVQPQRAAKDVLVNQYAYIRLHLHPKRFPAVYSVDWKVMPCFMGLGSICCFVTARHDVTQPSVFAVLLHKLYIRLCSLTSNELPEHMTLYFVCICRVVWCMSAPDL